MRTRRQGDVLFILTDLEELNTKNRVPQNIIVRGNNNHSVANGDFYPETGASELKIGMLWARNGCKIIHGDKDRSDHKDLKLTEGIWEVRRQREMWNGGIRIVVD